MIEKTNRTEKNLKYHIFDKWKYKQIEEALELKNDDAIIFLVKSISK